MHEIVSVPQQNLEDTSGYDKENQFGYFETKNSAYRRTQEDALSWRIVTPEELTPYGESIPLNPIEIGHRLWTSYQLLDKPSLKAGSTASTTVYDGKGNLITATLADAAAFVAIYDTNGKPLGVVRLNSVTHKPTFPSEAERIKKAGGTVLFGRVDGQLAVSRAIGDADFKQSGVCSSATIDITSVDQIAEKLKINPKDIGTIQVISTCDGFTDGAKEQTKEGHERFLLETLQNMDSPGKKNETELAKGLVEAAKKAGSKDNISIAIQTITQKTNPFIMGLYDGHGGTDASIEAAQNIGDVFTKQCTLTREAYAQQELSVNKKETAYRADNSDSWKEGSETQYVDIVKKLLVYTKEAENSGAFREGNEVQYKDIVQELFVLTTEYQKNLKPKQSWTKQINPILEQLITKLNNDKQTYQERIKEFYTFLDAPATLEANVGQKNASLIKNIDIIKKDTSVSATNYLIGILIILATLVTGIVPGLLVTGIVYAVTGKQPLDLFKTNSERYEKDVNLVKASSKLHGAFFEQPPSMPKLDESLPPQQTLEKK